MALVQQFDVDLELVLSTLAAGAIIRVASSIDSTRENGFRITKSRITVGMTGKTTAEGPLLFGVDCNFDNSAQVTAALNANPQKPSDDDSRGTGSYIRFLGMIGLVPTVFPASDEGVGQVFEISYGKNGWSIPEGSALNYWVRNNDNSALTAGTILQFSAEHFGVWLRD